MPTLAELRRDLQVTRKDLAAVVSPGLRELMTLTPNAGFGVSSDYAFRCACCSAIEGEPVFYALLKEVVGGMYGGRTDAKSIHSVKGIVRIRDLGFTPEYSSLLHMTGDGPVCDHCNDSVYSDD